MSAGKSALVRGVGFGLATLVFAVTQPLVLAGLPLAVLLIATGPRHLRAGVLVAVIVASAFLGERSGLWWFERGWPLMLAGVFVWVETWRREWGFSTQALAALGLAVVAAAAIFAVSSGAWLDINSLMAARANAAAQMARALVADRPDVAVETAIQKVVGLQVTLFPALLAISSMAALGVAVTARDWLAGEWKPGTGRLRSFRFNDHLVWVWLLGLGLLVAPVGQIADRIGGNAMFFMGALYVLRGVAVLLSIVGAIPLSAAILGGLLAVLLYPALALILAVALIVGLGDTWLNLRGRFAARGGDK